MKLSLLKPTKGVRRVYFLASIIVSVFPAHSILVARTVLNINADWKFYRGNASGATAVAFNDNVAGWSTVHLPHTFEYTTYNPGNSFYHGIGTYRKHLTIDNQYAGKKIYLTIEGASSTAQVYVNGTQAASHYYGWTPVVADITNLVTTGEEDNVITVFVDNTAGTDIPGTGGPLDFIINGGLYRDAYLTITDKVHIPDPVFAKDAGGGTFVTYPRVSAASASIALKTWVKNSGTASAAIQVRWTILNTSNAIVATAHSSKTVNANATALCQGSITLANPSLWDPSNSYRYTVHTEVLNSDTMVLDESDERIGIRKIQWNAANGFFINDKPLKLFGVNRHEMWPFIGHAIPDNLQVFDARLIKNMGCNMVRLSHYPHDQSFLDACDSLGLLVYEEAPGGSNNGQTPPFSAVWDTRAKESMREMVCRDRNRPSVICWGTLNEPRQNATWEAEANAVIHALDTTRPTTMSRNYDASNNVYDVYAHNSFTGLPNANPDPSTRGYINSEHTGHTFPTKRDTAEQRLLDHAGKHEFMTEQARSRNWVAGGLGWCVFDYNSANSWSSGSNIMFHGVCDLMRIPKFAYYFYESQKDASEPMVHIANFWQINSPLDVKVYSNCEQVRLSTWNGSGWTTFATQSPDAGRSLQHPPFTFTLSSHSTDRLRAEGLIGSVVRATHMAREPGTPQKLVMDIEPDSIVANGSDICRALISIVDANGTVCPYATGTINVSLSGPGALIGDNPITAKNQAATHQCGSFGILIKSQYGKSGTITAAAASGGLGSASAAVASLPYTDPVALVPEFGHTVPSPSFLRMQYRAEGATSIKISCQVPDNEPFLLRVIDIKGRLVKTLVHKQHARTPFDVCWNHGPCGKGVYLLTATSGNDRKAYRIVLQ
ncbi:MAG: beta galactosidase jelly roll domain-containing protein [Chitinispirillaceae bacterium]|nr:beta galactosidase jelly roll domain-containing protein [Chitinispirillaceae bacterium]